MVKKDDMYYRYYYMIRAILFGDCFNEALENLKELDIDSQFEFLYYLNKIIKNNDFNRLINENTKCMVEDIICEMTKSNKDKIVYNPFNRLINQIKVNLNKAKLYDEESYLMSELSCKMGVREVPNSFSICEPFIRTYINLDYILYDDILYGDIDIEKEKLNFSYIFSINTYICDIDAVLENPTFISNTKKIVNSTLDYIDGYESRLPKKETKLYRKNINKISKRIK